MQGCILKGRWGAFKCKCPLNFANAHTFIKAMHIEHIKISFVQILNKYYIFRYKGGIWTLFSKSLVQPCICFILYFMSTFFPLKVSNIKTPLKYVFLNFIIFFRLQDCGQPFGGRSFFDHEGLPYCETHYHAKRGSLCASCQKPITGRCITAMYKKFHPEHFVCAFCLKQLNKGTFKEQNDKPYCHPCFVKLFG